jgi:hypothetical protein
VSAAVLYFWQAAGKQAVKQTPANRNSTFPFILFY